MKIDYRNSRNPVIHIDGEGYILYANDIFCEMFNFRVEDFGKVICSEIFKCQSKAYLEKLKTDGSLCGFDITLKGIPAKINAYADFDKDGNMLYATVFVSPSDQDSPNYNQIFHNTTVPILVFDPESRKVIDVNKACCDMYGYEKDEFVCLSIDDINCDDYDRISGYLKTIFEEKGHKTFIFRHKLKSGEVRYIETKPSPINLGGRDVIFESLSDVTEKHYSEINLGSIASISAMLMKSEVDLNRISELIVAYAKQMTGSEAGYAGSIDADTGSLVIHHFSVNDKNLSEKIPYGSLITLGSDGVYDGLWGHSLNTCKPFYTNDVKGCGYVKGTPEGHIELYNFLSLPVLFDGVLIGQISIGNSPDGYGDHNVTAMSELIKLFALAINNRKERQYERLFRKLFDSMGDGVAIYSRDESGSYAFKDLNRYGVELRDLPKNKIIGRTIEEIYPGLQCNELINVFDKVWEDGLAREHPLVKYGEGDAEMWFENHISKLDDKYLVVIYRNVTEREKMQQELRDFNENLRMRVVEEIELREKQERSYFEQKKLADMGQMMNAIAHQWRQPINTLGLFVQYITTQFKDGDLTEDDIDEFYTVSNNMIQHMSNTIDDFRNFCMPDHERMDYEVVKEVRSTMKLMESKLTMDNVGLTLTCRCPHKPEHEIIGDDFKCEHGMTVVYGYPGELKQALANIVYNALDAIAEKRARTGNFMGRIDIEIQADDDGVSILCANNGEHIPEEILPHIFNPYFTTKDEGKGTGIGLYMTKLVIEKYMDGKVVAKNTDNGASFAIFLPKKTVT